MSRPVPSFRSAHHHTKSPTKHVRFPPAIVWERAFNKRQQNRRLSTKFLSQPIMPDRWRDDDRERDYDYYDDTTASSMGGGGYNSRGGRGRGNDDWRHDAYEEGDWKRRRTNEDSVRVLDIPVPVVHLLTLMRMSPVRVRLESSLRPRWRRRLLLRGPQSARHLRRTTPRRWP